MNSDEKNFLARHLEPTFLGVDEVIDSISSLYLMSMENARKSSVLHIWILATATVKLKTNAITLTVST